MRLWLACLALLLGCLSSPAMADDNRPLTITIEQSDEDGAQFEVTWKVPSNVSAAFLPDLHFPQNCVALGQQRDWSDSLGHWRSDEWHCADDLSGKEVSIDYPLANPRLATIGRLHFSGAATQTILLQPNESVLTIPAEEEIGERAIFPEFIQLGFEHIWEGLDHLLFVAGLIIIAGTWRRILVTVTGFTIAHSVTLAAASLELVHLPIRAVETVIALSIIFLAVEIVKARKTTLTWRRPLAVSVSFGLLHGFGFAAVLGEVGLPQEGLLTALLAFNIGIELGQVIFAGVLFCVGSLLLRLKLLQERAQWLRKIAGYGLGIIASFWLIERLIG